MKASTQKQFVNATLAGGPRNFQVRSSYTSPSALKPGAAMSYREAVASARIVREAGGWAEVARIGA